MLPIDDLIHNYHLIVTKLQLINLYRVINDFNETILCINA